MNYVNNVVGDLEQKLFLNEFDDPKPMRKKQASEKPQAPKKASQWEIREELGKRNEKKSWTPSSGNEKKKTNSKCRLKRKRSRKLTSKKKNAMSENSNAKRCKRIEKRPRLNRRPKSNFNLFIIFLINFSIENSSTYELL